MKFKNFLKYILFLLPWFISSLFMINNNYYRLINKPFFAPPGYLFGIIWPILFILIAYSIYLVYPFSDKYYKKVLIINYLFNQLFTLVFFVFQNNFLAFVDTVIVFVSSLYLYEATHEIDKKASLFLLPYIIWNVFALILSMTIVIIN